MFPLPLQAMMMKGAKVYSTEKVVDGDGVSGITTAWATNTNQTLAIVSGEIRATRTNTSAAESRQTVSGLTVGRAYRFRGTIRRGTAATAKISIYNSAVTTLIVEYVAPGTTNTSFDYEIIAPSTSMVIFLQNTGTASQTAFYDNISLMEVVNYGGLIGTTELVTNGDGLSVTGWTASTGTWLTSSGEFRLRNTSVGGAYATRSVAVTNGKRHYFSGMMRNLTADGAYFVIKSSGVDVFPALITTNTQITQVQGYFIANGSTVDVYCGQINSAGTNEDAFFDNISIRLW